MANALRWMGRVSGLALLGLMGAFLAGDGGPELFRLDSREATLMVPFAIAIVGLVVGWRWERLGGFMIVGGVALFYATHFLVASSWPRGWGFAALVVPGVFFLMASGFEACRSRHLKATAAMR
jgi:peptidoglycan/LPS O-acetylase OafA/YrhL